MDCKRYKSWLSDAVAGALGPAREAELRAHVEACSDCRALLERERALFEAIDRGVQAHLAAAPSPEFAARARMRLAEEAARPSKYGLNAGSRLGTGSRGVAPEPKERPAMHRLRAPLSASSPAVGSPTRPPQAWRDQHRPQGPLA